MTTKKNNALKRQLYGTPLPLPCLDRRQETLQKQTQPQSTANFSHPIKHYLRWVLASLRYVCSGSDRLSLRSQNVGAILIPAEYHPQGDCVWVKRDKDMVMLFRQGFFGKGTLSRSEATWGQRMKEEVRGMSLEEITRQRRVDRAQVKKNKREPSGNASLSLGQVDSSSKSFSTTLTAHDNTEPTPEGTAVQTSGHGPTASCSATCHTPSAGGLGGVVGINIPGEDYSYEHLQLSLEEAFFLVFAVESICVSDAVTSTPLSIQSCWLLFAECSAPQRPVIPKPLPFGLSADNHFIVRYVAYHYYRSQGWIVKDGLKYGADLLLYQKGAVFGHSLYAVRVIPSYGRHAGIVEQDIKSISWLGKGSRRSPLISPAPGSLVQHAALSWQRLLTLNRVIAQVQKMVILCHVVIPADATRAQLAHPRSALPLYRVVEIGSRRFIPEKNRA